MPIHAVIFDYGNVLTRTLDPTPRAHWEQRLGLDPGVLQRAVHNDHSWVAAQRGEITVQAYWESVGATLDLSPEETTKLQMAFYGGDLLNVELVAHIDQLRSQGMQVALLSNFSLELRDQLSTHDLWRRFDHVTISAEIGIMKPEAMAYQAVLATLELEPHACVFIDDLPANVEAAQRLGLHGIVFRDNSSCLAELKRLRETPL